MIRKNLLLVGQKSSQIYQFIIAIIYNVAGSIIVGIIYLRVHILEDL